jgi:peroxiredoxin
MRHNLSLITKIASRILVRYNTLMDRIFQAGDLVPRFVCRSSNNALFHFDTAAGRYMVLSFLGSSKQPEIASVLQHINNHKSGRYNDVELCFFGVTTDPHDETQLRQRIPGIRFFYDFDRAVSQQYGIATEFSYQPVTFVLDPLLRVIAYIPIHSAAEHNQRLEETLDALPPLETYSGVRQHAPVLVLPRIFEPEFCRFLIDKYQQLISSSVIGANGEKPQYSYITNENTFTSSFQTLKTHVTARRNLISTFAQ